MHKSVIATVLLALTITAITTVTTPAAASVLNISRPSQGQLGLVSVNPYGYAPLTAIIGLAGKQPTDMQVTVLGKGKAGVDIHYSVGHSQLLTYDGVPVFGLYANYQNRVRLSYTLAGKRLMKPTTSSLNRCKGSAWIMQWRPFRPSNRSPLPKVLNSACTG
ncbi:aryl-sulfate sulfotransferase N-terminal domain-containing protein [Shewanella dokdonensis]|uniref:aryl-sulfate sulfotransferase N-terminal domain-containing protein n=1 Tax=Shewanella dokdonensis TaxID=712036 RepID=UPI001FD15E6B|nr:aryl-sulfate sulfotransferase N-terminal domain-containing protein [Shewanella dokdonensis]